MRIGFRIHSCLMFSLRMNGCAWRLKDMLNLIYRALLSSHLSRARLPIWACSSWHEQFLYMKSLKHLAAHSHSLDRHNRSQAWEHPAAAKSKQELGVFALPIRLVAHSTKINFVSPLRRALMPIILWSPRAIVYWEFRAGIAAHVSLSPVVRVGHVIDRFQHVRCIWICSKASWLFVVAISRRRCAKRNRERIFWARLERPSSFCANLWTEEEGEGENNHLRLSMSLQGLQLVSKSVISNLFWESAGSVSFQAPLYLRGCLLRRLSFIIISQSHLITVA